MRSRIDILIDALDAEGEKRPRAAMARLRAMDPTALPSLRRAARIDSRVRVRRWALELLGQMKDRQALPTLKLALQDPAMSVRLHAIHGLVATGATRAGKALIPLLKDPSGGIRVNAVDALRHLRVPDCEAALLQATCDEKWYVRQRAALALSAFGRRKALPRLRAMLKDPNKTVRKAAQTTIDSFKVTDALNRVYAKEDSSLPPDLERYTIEMMRRVEWDNASAR